MSLIHAGSLSLASARQLPPGRSLYTRNRMWTKMDSEDLRGIWREADCLPYGIPTTECKTKKFSTTFFVRLRTVGGSDGSAAEREERLERVAAVSRGQGGLPTKANAGYRNRTVDPYR